MSHKIKINTNIDENEIVQQGDIFKDVSYIFDIIQSEGNVEIRTLTFPYVIVLSQSCDLYHAGRLNEKEIKSESKVMFSVIVAPIFEKETILRGEHLKELLEQGLFDFKLDEQFVSKRDLDIAEKDMHYRFHIFDTESNETSIPLSIIDFKNFFTLTVEKINSMKSNRIGRLGSLECQQIVNKFSTYLSRVGLPD